LVAIGSRSSGHRRVHLYAYDYSAYVDGEAGWLGPSFRGFADHLIENRLAKAAKNTTGMLLLLANRFPDTARTVIKEFLSGL